MNKNFNEINELLLQLLDTYGSKRDRKAGRDMYTCPLCHSGEHGIGSTGALNVGRKDGTMVFYCHSCGLGGNIASLWCEYHKEPNTKENFPKIVKGIKQDLGIPTEENNYDRFKKVYTFKNEITREDLNPCSKIEERKNYSNWFKYTLWKNQSHAVNYLKTRGIENAEKIAYDFNLGYGDYKWNGTDTVNAVFVPMFEDYNFNSEAVYSFSWRAVDQDLKKKRGKIHPLVPECLKPNSKDTTKKWVYLVEGEYDFFSILDIQYSIEKEGKTCEFSAISINSAGNLPRFIDELYQNGIISNGVGLIIALDNDKKFNQNVENFKAKGYRMAQKYRIPCIIADAKNLYLGEKDSNEALKKDRAKFQQALKLTVEQAKLLDINTYMKECEQMEKEIQEQNITLMEPEITVENITTSEVLGYMLNLHTELEISLYAQKVRDKARELKKPIKEVDKLLSVFEKQAKANLKIEKPLISTGYPEYIKVGDNGKPYQTIENCLNILQNDDKYKGKITFNEFSNKVLYNGKQWKDEDFSQLVYHMESNYNITQEKKIRHAFVLENKRNSFHPIKQYLDGLNWDGVPRLSTLFIDFLGADDNPYTRAVSTVTLTGAVARIYHAGVKYDTMPVLVGKQGVGKSTIWAKLGGEWYSDTLDTIKGKEAYESIQNSWIIEIAELSAMAHATKEDTKKFITKTSDKYRKPYAETVEEIPRQCIFVGTTNDYEFLKDETGNRRFYPIDVDITKATKSIWNDLTQEYINQLWAEAKKLYLKHGENAIYIKNEEILKLADNQQREHFEKGTTYSEVEAYLTMPVPPDWNTYDINQRQDFIARYRKDTNTYATEMRKSICIREILADLYPNDYPIGKKVPRKDSNEIAKILTSLGWKQKGSCRTKLFGKQLTFHLF